METPDWGKELACIEQGVIGNASRFINHSCDSNAEVVDNDHDQGSRSVQIKALVNIEAGVAITISYGDAYFRDPNFICYCGTSRCRRSLAERVRAARREAAGQLTLRAPPHPYNLRSQSRRTPLERPLSVG